MTYRSIREFNIKQRCPLSNPHDQSLTELANAAFEQAAKKVIKRAIKTGTPVILWEGDAVKKVDPKTIIQLTKTN